MPLDSATASPRLVALATAVPPCVVRQSEVKREMARLFSSVVREGDRLLAIFENAQIDERHLCVPLEWFAREHTFGEKNALYVEHALRLSIEATSAALLRAGLEPADIDHVVFVSSTGIATPSIDALLANTLGFRTDVRRTPIWGLGCAGGAVGLSRARDFSRADPGARVLLVAVELCSMTFQLHDLDKRNLVATSLFSDGAAAAVIAGREVPLRANSREIPLEILASQSILWKDSADVMGWNVDGAGLHVVFSRDIPTIVRDHVRPSLLAFLDRCGVTLADVQHLAAHPGGVKVMDAYAEALGLAAARFHHAREVLRAFGNMSSPTCLFVLERFLQAAEIHAGEHAIVAALGPGFSAEYVLLRGAVG